MRIQSLIGGRSDRRALVNGRWQRLDGQSAVVLAWLRAEKDKMDRESGNERAWVLARMRGSI